MNEQLEKLEKQLRKDLTDDHKFNSDEFKDTELESLAEMLEVIMNRLQKLEDEWS